MAVFVSLTIADGLAGELVGWPITDAATRFSLPAMSATTMIVIVVAVLIYGARQLPIQCP